MTTSLTTVLASDNVDFDYSFVPLKSLRVTTRENEKTGKKEVSNVLVGDEPIVPTDRFWHSLFARFGFNSAFFKYFDYSEVFDRISSCESNDRMRVCIERGDKGSRLLAVSNVNKPLVRFSELRELVSRYGGDSVTYDNGLIESTHDPRNSGGLFNVGGDSFHNRFVLSCPIDGYGLPNVYLSMLRTVCTNGLVGYSKVFRSSLALGKASDNVITSLVRVLEGFNNEEGYAALRQRVESSQKSWASVYEAVTLTKLLINLHAGHSVDVYGDKALPAGTSIAKWYAKGRDNYSGLSQDQNAVRSAPILRAYEAMTGNPTQLYGVANMDALSVKRQRTLPVNCTVYDLVNFSTEVATHHADPYAARKLQAWVGNTLSEEYDMENTRDRFEEFADFHIDNRVNRIESAMSAVDDGLEAETI